MDAKKFRAWLDGQDGGELNKVLSDLRDLTPEDMARAKKTAPGKRWVFGSWGNGWSYRPKPQPDDDEEGDDAKV